MPEKKYVRTTWVDNSEPNIDAEHLNNLEEGVSGLYEPEFDDSGTVSGITGFPAFLSKIVSKMNPIAFYKDFKAGMAFVLHAGQLVNNGLCNVPGKYPLDAAYGKTLLDMIGNVANLPGGAADIVNALITQNSNFGDGLGTLFNPGDDLNNYTKPGRYYSNSASISASLLHCPYITAGFTLDVSYNASNAYLWQEIRTRGGGIKYYRTCSDASWNDWRFCLTDADMQCGSVSITPTAINKSTYKSITFPVPFSVTPGVTVSPITSGPNVVSASVLDVTTTGCKIYLTRSDAAQATSVMWIAVAK